MGIEFKKIGDSIRREYGDRGIIVVENPTTPRRYVERVMGSMFGEDTTRTWYDMDGVHFLLEEDMYHEDTSRPKVLVEVAMYDHDVCMYYNTLEDAPVYRHGDGLEIVVETVTRAIVTLGIHGDHIAP